MTQVCFNRILEFLSNTQTVVSNVLLQIVHEQIRTWVCVLQPIHTRHLTNSPQKLHTQLTWHLHVCVLAVSFNPYSPSLS